MISVEKIEQKKDALYQFKDHQGNWCNFMNEEHRQNTVASGEFEIRELVVRGSTEHQEELQKVKSTLQYLLEAVEAEPQKTARLINAARTARGVLHDNDGPMAHVLSELNFRPLNPA